MSTCLLRNSLPAFTLAIILSGCGGSSVPTPVMLRIDWGPRSRGVDGPSSALSAQIVVTGAKPGGGDISFVVDRPPGYWPLSQTYRSQENSLVGSFPLAVTFFSWPGRSGPVVGVAYTTLTVNPNGTTNDARVDTWEGRVQTVKVPAGQTIKVGEQKPLAAIVDLGLALEIGSYFWNVVQGSDHLRIRDGLPEGISAGPAVVTVTVDNVTSEPQTVTVVAQ